MDISVEAGERLVEPSAGLGEQGSKRAGAIEGNVGHEAARFFQRRRSNFRGHEWWFGNHSTEPQQLLVEALHLAAVERGAQQAPRVLRKSDVRQGVIVGVGRQQLIWGRAGQEIGEASRSFVGCQHNRIPLLLAAALRHQVQEVWSLQRHLDDGPHAALEAAAQLLPLREHVRHVGVLLLGRGPSIRFA